MHSYTTIYVSSYCYIRFRRCARSVKLLYMYRHTMYVPSSHTAICVSSYCYIYASSGATSGFAARMQAFGSCGGSTGGAFSGFGAPGGFGAATGGAFKGGLVTSRPRPREGPHVPLRLVYEALRLVYEDRLGPQLQEVLLVRQQQVCNWFWCQHKGPYTPIYVSSYYYICVLILLYMCPQVRRHLFLAG
jgi:hypothetical protein